jgi:hypothetical protein
VVDCHEDAVAAEFFVRDYLDFSARVPRTTCFSVI